MGAAPGTAPPYAGNRVISDTSTVEAQAGQGAEGQAVPTGTTPAAIQSGGAVSGLMAQAGLDWSNAEDRLQFLAGNPQFTQVGGAQRRSGLAGRGGVHPRHRGIACASRGGRTADPDGHLAGRRRSPIRRWPCMAGYGPCMPGLRCSWRLAPASGSTETVIP